MSKPRLSILNRAFRYRSAASTDVRATFQRLRREQRERDEQAKRDAEEAAIKTVPMRRKG